MVGIGLEIVVTRMPGPRGSIRSRRWVLQQRRCNDQCLLRLGWFKDGFWGQR
jgi:hypothetical protein